MHIKYLPAFAAALVFPFLAALPAVAQAPEHAEQQASEPAIPAEIAAAFPEIAESDLPFDTDYRIGRLDNGLRYIIRSNATPPGQGTVHFWVDFGSAAEGDDEEGYAHFIEHMAFNGSENMPEGEMLRLLEREGLAFGADTNASTGFDTTMYRLDLPRNDMSLLDTALMLMRETASNLSFTEEAVQREKGVILSERRVRDTYQLRSVVDSLAFGYPGSTISRRLPIGQVEDIQNATGASLRDLYERYYRPENTAIIVIGDFDAAAVEAAVREHFADWQGEARSDLPPFGPVDPDYAGETHIYLDPALPEQITVSRNSTFITPADTEASRRERMLRQIGYGIVTRRLQRLARLEDPPFRGAAFGTSDFFREGRTTTLTVLAADGEWERGLAAAQEEYRRALEYGFTEAEVTEQIANLRNAIENNAAGAATRPNSAFVSGATALLRDGQVPTTPTSALERFNAQAPSITPEAVLAAMTEELVPLDNPLIRYSGSTAPEGGELALRTAWDAGIEAPLAANDNTATAEFAYSDFGPAGAIASDTVREDLGIRQIVFDNGLMLNLKQTELQDDRVLLQLNVDGGDLLATRDNPLATAMFGSLPTGGLGEHTFDELQTILAGRAVDFGVTSTEDTFRWNASTTPRDLELQLELMAAGISDPAFRPTAEEQFRRNIANFFRQRFATPASALRASIGEIASDGDPRHSLQSEDAYMALSFDKLRSDTLERWQNGAMELAIVGDIDEDATIALVARTLGAASAREASFRDYADNRDRSFTADRDARVIYHDGAENQALLVMMWPTRDDSDPREAMVLEALERVLRLEMLDVLREELGQTYSPSVDADQSRTYPGYGTFDISAAVDVEDVDATRAAMLTALEAIRDEAVDEDLLLRARQPLLEAYANALDSNPGWMNIVDRAQTEPDRIDRLLTGAETLRAITPEELRAAAALYLDLSQRLELLVLPRPVAQ